MDPRSSLDTAKQTLLRVADRPDIVMESGHGMRLRDSEGREYLDYIGGWAVNCLGHSPAVISRAISSQARTLVNASPAFLNEPMLRFAEALVSQSALDRVFFMSIGAEANEGAIKLARKFGLKERGGATDIITTQGGFHGRTLATMAASGKPQWQTLFGQAVPGFRKALFGDIDSVRELADDGVCAVMVEPVQGEGGVNVAPLEFITGLRQLCDELGLLLILDEVQTGMGRTGKLFAHEHYGVVPDVLTLGKGIGGGFPLSAMLVGEDYDIFDPGDQGGTYTGQPLAMAAGLAVLETLVAPGFLEHVGEMSEYTARRLEELAATHEVTRVRGLGLLQAFDLEQSRGADVVKACLADGLIINSPKDATIRLMPPLIVEPDDVDEMVEILSRHLATR